VSRDPVSFRAAPTGLGLDQLLADQAAIDGRAQWNVLELLMQLRQDRPWPPAGMACAHRDDAGFDNRRDLVWAAVGFGTLLAQCRDPVVGIAEKPAMNRLRSTPWRVATSVTVAPVSITSSHGEKALLKHRKLHQRHDGLLGSGGTQPRGNGLGGQWSEWDTGTGASVAQVPKPGRTVRHGNRSQSETDLPNSHTLSFRQRVGAEGLEPPTCWL
jgi:hypothetical protein